MNGTRGETCKFFSFGIGGTRLYFSNFLFTSPCLINKPKKCAQIKAIIAYEACDSRREVRPIYSNTKPVWNENLINSHGKNFRPLQRVLVRGSFNAYFFKSGKNREKDRGAIHLNSLVCCRNSLEIG